MSLPFYRFGCTACNLHRTFFFDTAYEFDSAGDSGYAPLLKISWCHDCDKVVTSVNPQTPDSIVEEVKLRSEWIAEQQRLKRDLFHPFRKPDGALIEKWESKIADLKMSVEYFRCRAFVPSCLTCGGSNITDMELPESNVGRAAIGVEHHCGGEVYGAIEGGIRFGDLPVVLYGINGRILSDQRENHNDAGLKPSIVQAIIGLAGNASLAILDAAEMPESVALVTHPEFSILGVYLSSREFLAVTEHEGSAVQISSHILTNPPYFNQDFVGSKENLEWFRQFCLDALRKYDREANRCFGVGPAPWSISKESNLFGQKAFQILFERLGAYPELETTPFNLCIEGIENAITKQPELLSTAFNELLSAGVI